MSNTTYYDLGYIAYTYAYHGGFDKWQEDRSLYSKYADCILVGEGFNSIRKELYPWYKANRDTPLSDKQAEYRDMARLIFRDVNDSDMFTVISSPLSEADDLLAIRALQGYPIVSNDKDFAQLPEWCNIKKLGGSNLRDNLYAGLPKSLHDIHLSPNLYLLTLCLFGDKVDNIPRLIPKGVKAIKESRVIYESAKPWENAYMLYGEALLDNLWLAVLPNTYALNHLWSKEDIFNFVSNRQWHNVVLECLPDEYF